MDFLKWFRAQRDRVAGWACVAVGAVMVLSGWLSISETSVVSHQLPYLASGGIGGIFFLGAGFGLLIRADLHDEWRKLDRLESALSGITVPETQELRISNGDMTPKPGPVGQALMATASNGNGYRYTSTGALAAERPVTARQEAIALLGLVAAGALVALGWLRTSASNEIQLGLDSLALGVVGVLTAGAVVAHHSGSVRRRIGDRVGRLFALVAINELDERPPARSVDGGWYRVEGSRRYHRPDCAVLNGQRSTVRLSSPADLATLSPCRLCDAG